MKVLLIFTLLMSGMGIAGAEVAVPSVVVSTAPEKAVISEPEAVKGSAVPVEAPAPAATLSAYVAPLEELVGFHEKEIASLKKTLERWNEKLSATVKRRQDMDKDVQSMTQKIAELQKQADKKSKNEISRLTRQITRVNKDIKSVDAALRTQSKELVTELKEESKESQTALRDAYQQAITTLQAAEDAIRREIMNTSTVAFHRVLRSTPERVYKAFLDADAMAKWLPPNGFTGKVYQLDAKVGGTYKMSFTNFTTGKSHSFGGKYLELVPSERIRYSDRFDDPNLPGEMLTTVQLKKVSVGTEIQIEQSGIPSVIPAEACYLGWQESLILLGKLVEAEIPD